MPRESLRFQLKDGTHVTVIPREETCYEFHLTRLNSEKHNFFWKASTGEIIESYETRFDRWQNEAIARFKEIQSAPF